MLHFVQFRCGSDPGDLPSLAQMWHVLPPDAMGLPRFVGHLMAGLCVSREGGCHGRIEEAAAVFGGVSA